MAMLRHTGQISLLRVHEVGSGFGGAGDRIDAEVIVQMANDNDRSFGFQLRPDRNRVAHQAMFDLLRDAHARDQTVTLEFQIEEGRSVGEVVRVILRR